MSLIDGLASPTGSRSEREVTAEIREELEFHLAMVTQENESAGMDSVQARQAAVRQFGDVSAIESACRGVQLKSRRWLACVQLGVVSIVGAAVLWMAAGAYQNQSRNDETLLGLQHSVDRLQDHLSLVVDRTPPVVVATFPSANDTEVDPNTSEIRVTFSKAMMDGSWSWCETQYPFPELDGEIHFADGHKTCVMPVKLEADTEYVLRLNSEQHDNFKDAYGRAAEPFLLCFRTASAP